MAATSSSLSSFSSSTFIRSTASRASRTHAPVKRVHFRRQFSVSASCAATAERPAAAARHCTAAPSSLYEVLGIQAGASCQEIKTAYRRLARVLHPDVARDCNGREFMIVHEAYSTLSDPQKRADYDRTLFMRRRRVGSSAFSSVSVSAAARSGSANSGFSANTRRKWETDQCW